MKEKRQCIICGSTQFLARTEDKCLKCLSSNRKKGEYIIGIDPDREKSGFAVFNTQQNILEINSHSFFELFKLLEAKKESISLIRIEAGWLNKKSNFHNRPGQSKEVGEKIANSVGANAETGKKICEMCEYLEIPYETVKPLGTKSIDSKLFKKITGYTKRTNQDQRDAAMLVWDYK